MRGGGGGCRILVTPINVMSLEGTYMYLTVQQDGCIKRCSGQWDKIIHKVYSSS